MATSVCVVDTTKDTHTYTLNFCIWRSLTMVLSSGVAGAPVGWYSRTSWLRSDFVVLSHGMADAHFSWCSRVLWLRSCLLVLSEYLASAPTSWCTQVEWLALSRWCSLPAWLIGWQMARA